MFIIVVAASHGGGGHAKLAGPPANGAAYEDLPKELRYMRMRQGLDPEAVPALAIIGVRSVMRRCCAEDSHARGVISGLALTPLCALRR